MQNRNKTVRTERTRRGSDAATMKCFWQLKSDATIYVRTSAHPWRDVSSDGESPIPPIRLRMASLLKPTLHQPASDLFRFNLRSRLIYQWQVNIRDATGNSPLHIACQYGHVHTVKTLIQYNANSGEDERPTFKGTHATVGSEAPTLRMWYQQYLSHSPLSISNKYNATDLVFGATNQLCGA